MMLKYLFFNYSMFKINFEFNFTLKVVIKLTVPNRTWLDISSIEMYYWIFCLIEIELINIPIFFTKIIETFFNDV